MQRMLDRVSSTATRCGEEELDRKKRARKRMSQPGQGRCALKGTTLIGSLSGRSAPPNAERPRKVNSHARRRGAALPLRDTA